MGGSESEGGIKDQAWGARRAQKKKNESDSKLDPALLRGEIWNFWSRKQKGAFQSVFCSGKLFKLTHLFRDQSPRGFQKYFLGGGAGGWRAFKFFSKGRRIFIIHQPDHLWIRSCVEEWNSFVNLVCALIELVIELQKCCCLKRSFNNVF